MKVKVVEGFKKGDIVKKYQQYGNPGTVTEPIYKIRSIGPTAAIVDRLDPATMQKVPYRRGRTEYKNTIETFNARRELRSNLTPFECPYMWAHIFVKVGQEGWDPDF